MSSGYPGWPWPLRLYRDGSARWGPLAQDGRGEQAGSRTRTDMWLGTLAGAVIGTVLAGAIGAYAAAATLGTTGNPFVIIGGISTGWLTPVLLLVFVGPDNWTINVLNLYTGGLSIANIFERLGRFWATLIASVQAFVAVVGYRSLRTLSRLAMPVELAIFA